VARAGGRPDLIAAIADLGEAAWQAKAQPIILKPIADLNDPSLRLSDLLGQLTSTQKRVLDRIASASEAADFLARERAALSPEGRLRFLSAVVDELMAAIADGVCRRPAGRVAAGRTASRLTEMRLSAVEWRHLRMDLMERSYYIKPY
jgi:hypothetical protein